MGQPNWAKDHVKRYKASNGVDGHIWDGLDGAAQYKGEFPTLLLTTTGVVNYYRKKNWEATYHAADLQPLSRPIRSNSLPGR